ncbi:MAG: hypothetical protein LBS50_06560, partial [Prevotellaceae bacterium]|nr:hypothetical protein [Prevotellaceae bacterium]
DKGTKLISVLNKNLDGKMNKARIKFLGLFICALCKVQTVSFQKLASAFVRWHSKFANVAVLV